MFIYTLHESFFTTRTTWQASGMATTTPHHLDVTVPRQQDLLRPPPLSASDDDDDEWGLGINGSIGT